MKSPLLIHEVAPRIQRRELTPVDLLESCLKQIDRYEERVRAWVFVAREEAREQAEELTKELQRGNCRGPLHGIPIGIKDIIDVKEWPTAAGSKRWANAIAREDAEVVKQLRDAGCVFLGKTVTTAFASFDPPVTRNPWDLTKTPGGSSSGSAAAVACGMCLGALATQTGGSITRPASYCGVYSLKPEFGKVSVRGVVPLAESMDHVGLMANCVFDLAILYSAICDYQDFWKNLTKLATEKRYRYLGRDPEIMDLAIFRGFFEDRMESEMRRNYDEFCDRAFGKKIHLIERALPPSFGTILEHHLRVMSVEAAQWHRERYRRHPEDYPPRITSLIESGLRDSAVDYAKTKEHQRELRHELLYHWEAHQPTLTPATTGPAVNSATTGDPAMNSPWSYLGFPTISLPFAWSDANLPLALQIVNDQADIERLFRTCLELEARIEFPRRDLPL